MKAISVLALLAVMTTSAVPIYKPACTCELNKHNQCVITVKQKEKDCQDKCKDQKFCS